LSRVKILHYRQVYLNHPDPDPITFIPITVDTSGLIYDVFRRLLILYSHRETSTLDNELPEESGPFRFRRTTCLVNFQGSVGLILEKTSSMRISMSLDLSGRSFIPLPFFIYFSLTVYRFSYST
jgi:hypothetical protein